MQGTQIAGRIVHPQRGVVTRESATLYADFNPHSGDGYTRVRKSCVVTICHQQRGVTAP